MLKDEKRSRVGGKGSDEKMSWERKVCGRGKIVKGNRIRKRKGRGREKVERRKKARNRGKTRVPPELPKPGRNPTMTKKGKNQEGAAHLRSFKNQVPHHSCRRLAHKAELASREVRTGTRCSELLFGMKAVTGAGTGSRRVVGDSDRLTFCQQRRLRMRLELGHTDRDQEHE